MIAFQPGTGPDSRAVGVALEEMALDFQVVAGRSPLPVLILGGARMPGASVILGWLAQRTGQFTGEPADVALQWAARITKAKPGDPDLASALETQLAVSAFLAGPYSIADMAGVAWALGEDGAVRPATRRWRDAILLRPAAARGLGVGG